MVNKQYTVQNLQARNYTAENNRQSKPTTSNLQLLSATLSNNLDLTTDTFPRNYMRDPNVRPYSSSQNSDNASEHDSSSLTGNNESNKQGYRDKDADINKIGRFQYIVQMDHEMVRK